MPDLRPHPFEAAGLTPYCARCQLPMSNRVHTVLNTRSRVVLVLDHPRDMTPEEIVASVTEAFTAEPRLILADVQAIP